MIDIGFNTNGCYTAALSCVDDITLSYSHALEFDIIIACLKCSTHLWMSTMLYSYKNNEHSVTYMTIADTVPVFIHHSVL